MRRRWGSDRGANRLRGLQLLVESLEGRVVPSSVTTYHNDIGSSGQNLAETQLTRANVNPNTFGKLFSYAVDGQVYAQPLVQTGVNITVGGNQGIHDVVFVATQHDSLYALDASSGDPVLLWKRSFLDTGLPGATSVTSVPNGDTGTGDITVEIGITGTPVIDTSTNTLYVIAKTKETVAGVDHYVQRLHAINVSDGTDRVAPMLIGDTSFGNSNNTSIYVYGNGDGSVVDPYNGTGRNVVQFNALREHQRGALTMVGGVIYAPWASHGDNGPYHGWVVGFDPTTLAVRGVFNTTPNGGLGGIWQAGGALTSDGTNLFFETGNGTFDGDNGNDSNVPRPGTVTGLNAQGFPVNGNYGDSFLKVSVDPTTSPTNQNINGWGLKVADYFTPFDQQYLNVRDLDVGSAATLVLPDEVGSNAHRHLLIGSGKEGIIYLIDRDNMGKYGSDDSVVQKVGGQLSGSLDTAAYYQNQIFYVEGYGGNAKTFSIANASMSNTPTSRSADSYAFAGSTPSISANGPNDGIVWDIDRGTNQLRAYSTEGYGTELYTSAQAAGNRDVLGAAVKFQVPTVINGRVYVGSGTGAPNNYINVYGLIQPPDNSPNAPTNLAATAVSGSQINLSWTPHDMAPNKAEGYRIEQSRDGVTGWATVATSGAGTSSYSIGGLALSTTYYYRIRAFNVIGNSDYSNVDTATTSSLAPSLDFSAGFSRLGNGVLTFNGGSAVSGGRLQVTDTGTGEARSIFATAKQDITRFSTRFRFQLSSGDNIADGYAFVIQGFAATAVGGVGGGLGYGADNLNGPIGIDKSLALKFDLYNNAGEGNNSTGLYFNGAAPITPADDLTPSGVDLHSGDVFDVVISYDGSKLTLSIVDTVTTATFTKTYAGVNIPSLVGGNTAFVGFTGGTGGLAALQEIINWTYTPIPVAPPAIPLNVQATVTGYTAGSTSPVPLGVHVTWNSVPDATSYRIERKLGATGTFIQIARVSAPATSYQDDGLSTQTSYVYRIRATNASGDGAYSDEVNATTPALAPTPTKGVATLVSDHSITITWQDNADNEDGFQIFRSVNAGEFSLVASLPRNSTPAPSSASYTDLTVQPGTRYDYHVQAFNLAGYSDFSGITTYSRPSVPASVGVALTGTTAMSSTSVPIGATVSWAAAPGAVSYKIERKIGASGVFAQVGTSVSPTYHEDGLTPGTVYFYRVRATTPNIDGNPSAEISVTTPVAASAPTNGSVSFVSDHAITITWQDNAGNEDGFQVYRSVNSGPFTIVASLPANTVAAPSIVSYSDNAVQPGTRYDYRVQSFNLAGFSDSTAITARSQPSTPTQVAAKLTGTTASSGDINPLGATITWKAAAGATSYKIERSTGPDGNYTVVGTVNALATTFNEDHLSSNTTYAYRVRASSSGVDGAPSAIVVVTTPSLPAAPSQGHTISTAPDTLNVTWQDNSTNEDGFQIYRSINGGPFMLAKVLPSSGLGTPSTTGFIDSPLSAVTHYDYLVKAYNLAGFSGSLAISGTTIPPAPGIAQDVNASPTGYTAASTGFSNLGANVTWDSVPYASSYVVQRALSGTDGFFNLAQIPATSTSYQDQNLSAGYTYDYRVIAINSTGTGFPSQNATVALPTLALIPTAAQVMSHSNTSATIAWRDVSDNEDGFQIFRSVDNGPFTLLTTLPPNPTTNPSLVTYTDPTLTPGSRYDYQIRAFNLTGTYGYASASVTTALSAPSNVTATGSGNQIVVSWQSPSPQVTSYDLYRSTVSGDTTSVPYRTGITTTSFADSAVAPGVTYYYRVLARNGSLTSPLSAEVSASNSAQTGTIRINFSNSTVQVPNGFINDIGETFGPKPLGLAYGWDADNRANGRNRNSPVSPDEQHDSFILMGTNQAQRTWSIAVQNGTYRVHLSAGDPAKFGTVSRINVNGVLAIHGRTSKNARWIENTVTVVVTDGKIRISNARGAVQNKLNFVEITRLQ